MSEYLSTVAKSGQVNTPPGSYITVKEWARNSFINNQSSLLEIGCSNGFISIEMARYTGALCTGVDLHAGSIEAARANADKYVADRVQFIQGDAGRLPFDDSSFSHVVISGHLPFIDETMRRQHILESLRVLKPWGHLLVALYYYNTKPPSQLVEKFNEKIGTRLSPACDQAYWSGLFEDLPITLEYDAQYEIELGSSARTNLYIEQMSPETRVGWSEYLDLFNQNGRFLRYFVRIYRKVPDEIGVMLQIPRGGIYNVNRKAGGNL